MKMRAVLLGAVLLSPGHVPAIADDRISVTASEGTADGMTVRGIHFAGECGDECLLASLTCGGANQIEAELNDISSAEAAKSVGAERSVMIMKAGGKNFEMPIGSFSFTEMNGSWDATAWGQDPDAIYNSLGSAKSFTLSVETRSEKLPVTKEVLDWAKACLR